MYAAIRRVGGWAVMLHGGVVAQLWYEPGIDQRTGGAESGQVSSVNWGMAVARRQAGAGRIGLRGMVSLEPWTVSDCGFLNALATGERCGGDTIHDRQHPHDLLMELAADYDRPLRGALRWQLYAGLAGEPALGPVAFPHRLSAMSNPAAPIAHHWLDSTHVTFGVITTGVYDARWKAELSLFNGREPDAERADLDLAPLDSIAARASFLPSPDFAVQVSAAHLRDAEAELPSQPRRDVERITASASHHRAAGSRLAWATTAAYGMNVEDHDATHALLIETAATLDERHTWFGRAEAVQKSAHDLDVHEQENRTFVVGKLQAGYVRRLRPWHGVAAGLGATATAGIVPAALGGRYSGRWAPGAAVFITVGPARHRM
jgi:hypothetical protein